MALVDFNKPLTIDGQPAYNIGHGVWPGGIVYYVSTGVPPTIYPYNDLGDPINHPFFSSQGYAIGTRPLQNGQPDCECVIPDPEAIPVDDLIKDLYIVQWDGVFSLMTLEDIRFGYDVVKHLPESIVHVRLSKQSAQGPVTEIVTSELLDTAKTIEDFYSLGEQPQLPENYYYDDSLIYG